MMLVQVVLKQQTIFILTGRRSNEALRVKIHVNFTSKYYLYTRLFTRKAS